MLGTDAGFFFFPGYLGAWLVPAVGLQHIDEVYVWVYIWVAAHLCIMYIRTQVLRTVTFSSYYYVQSCKFNSFLRVYV